MRPHRAVRLASLSDPSLWEDGFKAALLRGDVLGASTLVREEGEQGFVRKGVIARARELIDEVAPSAFVRREWAQRLLAHPRRVDKMLAAQLLAPLAGQHPAEVERALMRLARDERAEVRDAAAVLLGEGLVAAFDHFVGVCGEWIRWNEAHVRRVVVTAIKHAQPQLQDRASALRELVAPAAADSDERVRKEAELVTRRLSERPRAPTE